MIEDILRWQKELRAGPKVWRVRVKGEDTGELYDSKDAAMAEVEFYVRHGRRDAVAYPVSVHTLRLAQERWGPRETASTTQPTEGET